jgi:hypothetical protein
MLGPTTETDLSILTNLIQLSSHTKALELSSSLLSHHPTYSPSIYRLYCLHLTTLITSTTVGSILPYSHSIPADIILLTLLYLVKLRDFTAATSLYVAYRERDGDESLGIHRQITRVYIRDVLVVSGDYEGARDLAQGDEVI